MRYTADYKFFLKQARRGIPRFALGLYKTYMHILYLTQFFCPPDGAGNTRSYEVARRWVLAGHKVTVVTSSARMPETYGVGQYRLDGIDLSVVRGTRGARDSCFRSGLRFSIAAMWRAARVDGPDVIVAETSSSSVMAPGLIASKVMAAPLVLEVRDIQIDGELNKEYGRPTISDRISNSLKRLVYRSGDHCLALGSGIKDALLSFGVLEDAITISPDGCDSSLFRVPADHGATLLEAHPYLRGGPLVVYGGAMDAAHGVSYFVHIAAAVRSIDPSIRFVICGSGPTREDIRTDALHIGVLEQNLWLIPPLPKHRMPELLSLATVLMSLFDRGQAGRPRSFSKMFDALAAGKPLVLNHGGAHVDLVESRGAGLILSPGDIETAARDLADFVRDDEALHRAGEQAAALADGRFNRDKLAGEYRALLEAVAQADPAPQRRRRRSLALKRTFDFVVAAAVLVLLSPVFLILAFIILIKMGWPILFSQVRPGLGGKPFRLSKFRTMKNTEDGAGNLLSDGERITALGRFLRRTSVDELPELFNVLKGDMSLVGPRPLLMEYLPYYDTDQERRHTVRPGMTGLAQVNGRNDLTWEEKFELDVWYVDNRSLWLDLKILCRTVWIVFTGQGVSAPGHDSMPRFDEIMARTQGAEDV